MCFRYRLNEDIVMIAVIRYMIDMMINSDTSQCRSQITVIAATNMIVMTDSIVTNSFIMLPHLI